MPQGHVGNISRRFWRTGFEKLAAGEHAKLQARLSVFTTTKGKIFSELDETQKSSSLTVKYFVTVATLNVTLVQ